MSTLEQRGLLQRAIEKVLMALHFTEVVIEVAPDGSRRSLPVVGVIMQ